MTRTESPADLPAEQTNKVSLPTLTAMVVGSMIGSGVFCCRAGSAPRPACSARSSRGPLPAPEC